MVEEAKNQAEEESVEGGTGANNSQPDIDSKYRMIILAAQRSKQIQRGAQPRVELDPRRTKPTRIALKEIEEGKVGFEIT